LYILIIKSNDKYILLILFKFYFSSSTTSPVSTALVDALDAFLAAFLAAIISALLALSIAFNSYLKYKLLIYINKKKCK
jgi:hypothetical protein